VTRWEEAERSGVDYLVLFFLAGVCLKDVPRRPSSSINFGVYEMTKKKELLQLFTDILMGSLQLQQFGKALGKKH